jgi:hypothetical protein
MAVPPAGEPRQALLALALFIAAVVWLYGWMLRRSRVAQ